MSEIDGSQKDDATDDREQHHAGGSRLGHPVGEVADRACTASVIGLRIGSLERLCDRGDLLVDLSDGGAGSETADDFEPAEFARSQVLCTRDGSPGLDWHPQVTIHTVIDFAEGRGQHAPDVHLAAMMFPSQDGDLASNYIWVAREFALPEAVAEQHAGMGAQLRGIGRV